MDSKHVFLRHTGLLPLCGRGNEILCLCRQEQDFGCIACYLRVGVYVQLESHGSKNELEAYMMRHQIVSTCVTFDNVARYSMSYPVGQIYIKGTLWVWSGL
jgi:hypothetical protein